MATLLRQNTRKGEKVMVTDPYKVLGVSRDATKEEIKKAYRQKGKEFHPDLHPDDPNATAKMAEINEAYDMLTNPEKYHKQTTGGSTYGNPYGNPYGSPFGQAWWNMGVPRPTVEPGDSSDIRQAIDFINMMQYQYANQTLNSMISSERNARWHYLSALANYGMGNRMFATEQIKKAIQMDPTNGLYQSTLQSMGYAGSTYSEAGREYRTQTTGMGSMCTRFCLAYFFCTFCRCC